jgi:GTPase SAR1 family protein
MTLEKLEEWVTLCRRGDPDLPILFLGTKNDLTEDIMVTDDYASDFQDTFKLFDYLKISSKSGENVQKAFELLTTKILDRQSY